MNRFKLYHSRWIALFSVVLGLVGLEAAAMDELIVYGKAEVRTPASAEEDLHERMGAYVEALNVAQKAKLDAAFAKGRAQQIQIAAAKIPTRG